MLVTERRKKSLREKGWIFHSAEGKMFLHYRVYGDFLKTSCMQKAGLPLPCLIQSGRQYRAASFAVPPEVSHKFNSYLPSSCTPTTLVKQGQRRGRLGCPYQRGSSHACCSPHFCSASPGCFLHASSQCRGWVLPGAPPTWQSEKEMTRGALGYHTPNTSPWIALRSAPTAPGTTREAKVPAEACGLQQLSCVASMRFELQMERQLIDDGRPKKGIFLFL